MESTEFVNAYIQKQSQLIVDLTNKNLMVETKLHLLEGKYNDLVQQHNQLVESIEKARLAAEQSAVEDQPLNDFAQEKEPTESQF